MFVSECVCCFIFVITIKYSDPINFKVCVWGVSAQAGECRVEGLLVARQGSAEWRV